jgi:hypothetical protein
LHPNQPQGDAMAALEVAALTVGSADDNEEEGI